jgi:RHS repeat-associated protein
LGSTRVLTDNQGNVTNAYDYEAFGKLLNSSGIGVNSYLFAGEQFDTGLGDYYLRDRFYDSDTGRFGRQDIYLGQSLNPISLNKYVYAYDNPASLTDPSGFAPGFNPLYKEIGNRIHDIVGLDFVSKDIINHRADFRLTIYGQRLTIARILQEADNVTYNGLYRNKRPDLADYGSHQIYEVKSNSRRWEGFDELLEYLAVLNTASGQTREWDEGTLYNYNNGPIYFPQARKVATIDPTNLGLVIYHLRNLDGNSEEVEGLSASGISAVVNDLNAEYLKYTVVFLLSALALRSSLGAFA